MVYFTMSKSNSQSLLKLMSIKSVVGWHHLLIRHKFEQLLGVGAGQGRLACCSPWGRKESDMTESLN